MIKNTPAPTLPANISHILTNYQDGIYSEWRTPSFILRDNNLSVYNHLAMTNPGAPSTLETSNTAVAMINIYRDIMDNTSYSNELKNVTASLMQSMDDLNVNLANNATYLYNNTTECLTRYDLLTGLEIESNYVQPTNAMIAIDTPTSPFTHLNSRLICASGGNQDNDNACHDP